MVSRKLPTNRIVRRFCFPPQNKIIKDLDFPLCVRAIVTAMAFWSLMNPCEEQLSRESWVSRFLEHDGSATEGEKASKKMRLHTT